MTPHPLSLTDIQMREITQAAKSVPPEWRSRFMEGVADQLMHRDLVTNSDVQSAIDHVLVRIGVAA